MKPHTPEDDDFDGFVLWVLGGAVLAVMVGAWLVMKGGGQ